ncbi:MAG: hypothetical protein ACU0CQ_17215 [Sulfitobacter sp.]|uniref:hypothetical protein n=1 Tax=Sulfitobacter sp. TaxID=1903071 RepID=UPI004059AEA4
MRSELMEHIWGNRLELTEAHSVSPLGRILNSLLAAPLTRFIIHGRDDQCAPFAMYAGEEIIPGATVADVMEEEFGLDLNEDAIILFEARSAVGTDQTSPEQLGRSIGNIIVSLASFEQKSALSGDGFTDADWAVRSLGNTGNRFGKPSLHIH